MADNAQTDNDRTRIADAIRRELHLLNTSPHDPNAVEAIQYAERLDTEEDLDPQVAYSVAAKLNERLLALQRPFWFGAPIPPNLHAAMVERAAAVRRRLPARISRPRAFDEVPRANAIRVADPEGH